MAHVLGYAVGTMAAAACTAWAYIVVAFTNLLPVTIAVFLAGVGIGILIERRQTREGGAKHG